MLKAILISVMMVTFTSTGSDNDALALSSDLSQFKWKNRLLFLFSPTRKHPSFDLVKEAVSTYRQEVVDRDLVIFEIIEHEQSIIDSEYADPKIAQYYRKIFEIPKDKFFIILIGKDGGIKLKSQNRVPLKDVFTLIDSMPMRQEEMRKKSN